MTSLEKKIDKITKEAGVELTTTTITKIADASMKYIRKAWDAGMGHGLDRKDAITEDQWLEEQKLK